MASPPKLLISSACWPMTSCTSLSRGATTGPTATLALPSLAADETLLQRIRVPLPVLSPRGTSIASAEVGNWGAPCLCLPSAPGPGRAAEACQSCRIPFSLCWTERCRLLGEDECIQGAMLGMWWPIRIIKNLFSGPHKWAGSSSILQLKVGPCCCSPLRPASPPNKRPCLQLPL